MKTKKHLLVFLFIFLTVGLLSGFILIKKGYAYLESFRLNHNQNMVVDAMDTLRYTIANSNGSLDYFIPNKTLAEWNAFRNADASLPDISVTAVNPVAANKIAAGNNFTCFIKTANNRIYCLGENTEGQLGDGTTTNRITPAMVSLDTAFSEIDAQEGSHVCAIRSDNNRVYCWGENESGQLGDGTTTNRLIPTQISLDLPFASVSVGRTHTCGIMAGSGRVYCWGFNASGQLGDGTNISRLTPTLVSHNGAFDKIDAGGDHTCAITNGTSNAYCWGSNFEGQLGDGTTTNRTSPTAIADTATYTAISTGAEHTCGIRSDNNQIYCWGAEYEGALGISEPLPDHVLTPTQIYYNYQFNKLNIGGYSTCAIKSDNKMYCWGDNRSGKLGINSSDIDIWLPMEVQDSASGSASYQDLTLSFGHTCGIRANTKQTYCWGYNAFGQIGDNTTNNSLVPRPFWE